MIDPPPEEPRPDLGSRLRFQWQKVRSHFDLHVRSRLLARRPRPATAEVERLLLFLGYGRSGSTLLASLLNTHPEVAIAHELDACWHVERGITRDRLFALLLVRHEWFAYRGWEWTGYDYEVPGTSQGSFRRLTVLGDKWARGTTVVLGSRPALVEVLRRTAGVPLRFVHQVRNPFDNITTMAKRNDLPLRVAARRYFRLAEDVARVRERLAPEEILDNRLEALVEDPRGALRRIFGFLGLEADDALLDACAGEVFPSPRRTRDSLDWPPELIDEVRREAARHPWLDGYGW